MHLERSGFGRAAPVARAVRLGRRAMVPLVGALALWVAIPAVASAETVWVVGGVPVTESTKSIKFSGTTRMTFEAPGAQFVEKCKDTGTGTVSPKGAGEVTSWTMTNCENIQNCGTGGSIEARGLPWHTQLSTVESTVFNSITGSPKIELKCPNALNGRIAEECGPVPSSIMTNTKTGVSAVVSSEKMGCLTYKARLESNQTLETLTGGVLQVS
jgi:hypothetical protein